MPAQVVNLTDTFDEWRIKSNISATLSFTALQDVIDDTTPELGGDLDVLTRSIVSSSNRNIAITPHGTGLAVITKGSYSGKLGGSLDVNGNAIVSLSNGNITITPHGTGNVVITKGTFSGELGANLDLNSNDVTGTGNINTTGNLTVSGVLTGASIAGTVVGTTQSASNNSTRLATTAYVDAQVATEDTLAEMNDTTISGLANLNILQYTGSVWENKTISAAGIPTLGFTIAMAVALG